MNGPKIVILLLFFLPPGLLVWKVASSWGRKKAVRTFQESRDQAIRAIRECEYIIDDVEYRKCMEREVMR